MRASLFSASWVVLAGLEIVNSQGTITENVALTVAASRGMDDFQFTITNSWEVETMTEYSTVTITEPPMQVTVTATEMMTITATVIDSICTTAQGLLTAPPMSMGDVFYSAPSTTPTYISPDTYTPAPAPPSLSNDTQAIPGMMLSPCPSCMCQCQLSVWPIAGISTGIATPLMSYASTTQNVVTAGIDIASSSSSLMSEGSMSTYSPLSEDPMSTMSTTISYYDPLYTPPAMSTSTSTSTPIYIYTTTTSTPMTTTMSSSTGTTYYSSSMITTAPPLPPLPPPPPPPSPPASTPEPFDISTYSLASAVIVGIANGALATGG